MLTTDPLNARNLDDALEQGEIGRHMVVTDNVRHLVRTDCEYV